MSRVLFAFILLILGSTLNAQRFDFDFFAVDDGLSDRQINELYIDKDGFLWVGTRDGLNRFDGNTFLPFGQGPYSDAGLSLGNIGKIGHDLEGQLMLFYQDFIGYFDRFDPETFEVEKIALNPATGVEGFPRAFAIDALGRVFIVVVSREKTSLYEYTAQGFILITTLDDEREWINPPVELLPLRNGQFLLFDGDYGLRLLTATGDLLDSIPISQLNVPPHYTKGKYERVEFLEQGPDGSIYFAFYGYPGLYELDIEHQQRLSLAKGFPVDVNYQMAIADKRGQLLFLGSKDKYHNDQFDHFYLLEADGVVRDYNELGQIGRRIYSATAFDFSRKIFLGLSDGLGIVNWHGNALSNYRTVEQEEEVFQELIRGITEDSKGNIYFTEEDGQLYRLNPNTNVVDSIYLHLSAAEGALLDVAKVNQLIYDAERNAIWGSGQALGGKQEGVLYCYELDSCDTHAFYYPQGGLNCMFLSATGELYLGSSSGASSGELLLFEEESGLFLPIVSPNGKNVLKGMKPYCINESVDGKTLYVGTGGKGLFAVDHYNGKTTHYKPQPWESSRVVFNDYTIYAIEPLTDGGLYLGTRGGLHYFHPESETMLHYGRKDGMTSNIISAIEPDTEGGYWISTYHGLTHFKPDGKPLFRNYHRSDGLSNDEFNRLSSYRSKKGRYYFGGVNGLTSFSPDQLQRSGDPPKVLISQVSLYGLEERKITVGLNQQKEIKVNKNERGIAIHFALPAKAIASRHRFRAKLRGLGDDWVDLGDEHIVRYNSLKSGSYTLMVQATDANGNYGTESVILPIRVSRYFYEQSWFLPMIGLLIVGFIIGFLQSKSRERLRNEQLRTRLSSDIHDEVSGLLAGITMQTELLQSYTEDEHLKTRLKGVGEAGRKAMSKMSDVIWSIDSRRDTTGDLLQRMQEHADDVLLPLEIRYSFRAEGLKDRDRQMAGNKRQDLYFIYKEIINNIARHSNASRVTIYLGEQGTEFEMIIRDNGKPTNGFDARRSAKTGQGLANLRMRAKRLNAELIVDKDGDNAVHLRMKRL